MEKWVDLHTHTSWSDGSYTPSDLVRYAKEKGLTAIAITDHECMSGIDGLEAYHSAYSQIDLPQMTRLAKKYELLISGGSDFHGQHRPNCDLGIACGSKRISYAVLDKIRSICTEYQWMNKYE